MRKLFSYSILILCLSSCSQKNNYKLLNLENINFDFDFKEYIKAQEKGFSFDTDSMYIQNKDESKMNELLGSSNSAFKNSKFKSINYNAIDFIISTEGDFIGVCAGSTISNSEDVKNTIKYLTDKYGKPISLEGQPTGVMDNKMWIIDDRIIQTASYYESNFEALNAKLSEDNKYVYQTFIYIINKKYIDKFELKRQSSVSGDWVHFAFIPDTLIKNTATDIKNIKKKSIVKQNNDIDVESEVNTLNGDFNGDRKIEIVYVNKDLGFICFLNNNIAPIYHNSTTGEFRLFNEGDLNNDGVNELSIYQSYTESDFDKMTTYSFINGDWTLVIDSFKIYNDGKRLSDTVIQSKVFKNYNKAYYYDFENLEQTFIQHAEDVMFNKQKREYKVIKKQIKFPNGLKLIK